MIQNAVATGSTALRLLQDRFAEVLVLDDYFLATDADYTNAFNRCLARAAVLNALYPNTGSIIKLLNKKYLVSATIVWAVPNVRMVGGGKGLSQIVRNTAYGDTILMSNGLQLSNVGIEGITFFHDTGGGAVMSGAHINAQGCQTLALENLEIFYAKQGIILAGGVNIRLRGVHFRGDYNTGIAAKNSTIGLYGIATANVGAVVLPSIVTVDDCQFDGPVVDSSLQYGTVINAAEQWCFTNTKWNAGPQANVYIQQTALNNPILGLTFGPGCVIDACEAYGFWIDGSLGNGSQPIANTQIIGVEFNGEEFSPLIGPGKGIHVNGTARAGFYTQAVQGLIITGCDIEAYWADGAYFEGGNNIIMSGCTIYDNNISNGVGINQVTLGPGVTNFTATGNRAGGRIAPGIASTAYFGFQVAAGATGVDISHNNVTNNAVGGINNLSTGVPITLVNNKGFNGGRAGIPVTLAGSGVDIPNYTGSPATLVVAGGAVSSIKLNATQLYTATGVNLVAGANDIANLTYTVAPTVTWVPQ